MAFDQAILAAGGRSSCYELPRDVTGKRSWERTVTRLAQWVQALPKPAGVMICSDQRGQLFFEACRKAGVAIPDEIAVLGVDNDEALCEVCPRPLSSVRAGHCEVGYRAAALLDALMRGDSVPREPLRIGPQGVITRFSSDVLAVKDEAVRRALQLIRERAQTSLSLHAIACHSGLSRSVLQRRFSSTLQRSVHQELLAVRVKRACQLLSQTDLPLSTVAECSGFKHQAYLGAVFKRVLGKTPLQVREER
jgi:LacI family transcriptional regulator